MCLRLPIRWGLCVFFCLAPADTKTSSKSEFSVILGDFRSLTSPKGEFEFGKVPSPKGEVLEVKIKVRIRVVVRMLIFFDFVDVFTQKRTQVIASIRFANARSRVVVLVIGKIVTGGFES